MTDREIICNQAVIELPDNSISTSKYTVLSFFPKNLMLQFSKMANLYFLVLNSKKFINKNKILVYWDHAMY